VCLSFFNVYGLLCFYFYACGVVTFMVCYVLGSVMSIVYVFGSVMSMVGYVFGFVMSMVGYVFSSVMSMVCFVYILMYLSYLIFSFFNDSRLLVPKYSEYFTGSALPILYS